MAIIPTWWPWDYNHYNRLIFLLLLSQGSSSSPYSPGGHKTVTSSRWLHHCNSITVRIWLLSIPGLTFPLGRPRAVFQGSLSWWSYLLFGHGGRGTLLISRRTPTVTGAASLLLPRLQVSSRSRPQGSSAVSLTGEDDYDSPRSPRWCHPSSHCQPDTVAGVASAGTRLRLKTPRRCFLSSGPFTQCDAEAQRG